MTQVHDHVGKPIDPTCRQDAYDQGYKDGAAMKRKRVDRVILDTKQSLKILDNRWVIADGVSATVRAAIYNDMPHSDDWTIHVRITATKKHWTR